MNFGTDSMQQASSKSSDSRQKNRHQTEGSRCKRLQLVAGGRHYTSGRIRLEADIRLQAEDSRQQMVDSRQKTADV